MKGVLRKGVFSRGCRMVLSVSTCCHHLSPAQAVMPTPSFQEPLCEGWCQGQVDRARKEAGDGERLHQPERAKATLVPVSG